MTIHSRYLPRLVAATVAALVMHVGPRSLVAQSWARPSCDAMFSLIARQAPRDSVLLADQFVDGCPGASSQLGKDWGLVPDDTVRMWRILESSARAMGRPLYDSLKAVATRSSRPLYVRGWALTTLLRWGRPGAPPPSPSNLEAAARGVVGPEHALPITTNFAPTDPSYEQSRVDLASWYVSQFIENVSQPMTLRNIASTAADYLASDKPSSFLPLGSRIAVRYRCGARWWVVNRLRVSLPLELRVSGTAAKQTIMMLPVPLSRGVDSLSPDLRLFGRAELWMDNSLLATYVPGVEAPVPCP